MKKKKLLNDIYYEQRTINRNLQSLSNVALLGLLMKLSKDAKEKDDETAILLCKIGLCLVVVARVLIIILEFFDFKGKRDAQRFIEKEC